MVLFFIDALITLLISFILFFYYFKNPKPQFKKFRHASGVLGILYLILSIILTFLSFDLLQFQNSDFASIITLFIFLESIIIFYLIFNIKLDKKIGFFITAFILLALIFFIGFQNALVVSSLVFMLSLMIYYCCISEKKISGYLGITYAAVNFIIYSVSFILGRYFLAANLISNIFFIAFVCFFLRDLSVNRKDIAKKSDKKKEFYMISFIRYLIFILVLVNLVMIASLGVHEVGHLVFSKIYGCDYGRIVYDVGMPRTEIVCGENINEKVILLGGLFLPLFLALLLFAGGGKFIREIALIIFGFDLIFSYQDLIDMLIPQSVVAFILLIGVAEVGMGISMLAKSRTEEENQNVYPAY